MGILIASLLVALLGWMVWAESKSEIRQTRIIYFSKGKLIRCKGDPP